MTGPFETYRSGLTGYWTAFALFTASDRLKEVFPDKDFTDFIASLGYPFTDEENRIIELALSPHYRALLKAYCIHKEVAK